MTNAPDPSAPDTRPWRKRRPVFSRVVLYVLGLAIAGVIFLLLSEREDLDAEDRMNALRQELRGMPGMLLGLPNGSNAILEKLDAKFSDPDLPDDVRSLVARTRALAFRATRTTDPDELVAAHAGVEREMERAVALAPAEELQALHLEWAEFRLEVDQPETVPGLLQDEKVSWTSPTAKILRAYLMAAVKAQQGNKRAAAQEIDGFLAGLHGPLSAEEDFESGGRPWSPSEAAMVATERLARWRTGDDDPRFWERLAALTPRHCRAQVRAAAGFAAMGREEMALSTWQRAQRIDPDEAKVLMERETDMLPLKRLLEKKAQNLK